ncbi:preprotein translocase subunit SecG [Deinococcus sp. Marseille-Q6407]|uniref:preprotein translocase subunit SecG n=1 Tax=Deinococcus sp. Marseille-Q6407 TaxID=2969223 RepID=UPI0021C01F1B|nr:preprotein translocase subunit SecG [Deinococcus sp. Marseille-Q6407]
MILTVFLIIYALVAVGIVFFVLLQTPKQAGLSPSMASGGDLFGGQGVEGGLIRTSAILGGLFMLLALLIDYIS